MFVCTGSGPTAAPAVVPYASASSSSEEEDRQSQDSATQRTRKSESRLRDYGEEKTVADRSSTEIEAMGGFSEDGKSMLPEPDALFSTVTKPPDFLNPEAIRPVPYLSRGEKIEKDDIGKEGKNISGAWDIAKSAPKLPSQSKLIGGGKVPGTSSTVISAAAVKYKLDHQTLSMPYDMDQNVRLGTKRSTQAMPVEEFIHRDGASLPRKRQEQKEKEKSKRMRGQSSHSTWKTEAEMVLRQQYD